MSTAAYCHPYVCQHCDLTIKCECDACHSPYCYGKGSGIPKDGSSKSPGVKSQKMKGLLALQKQSSTLECKILPILCSITKEWDWDNKPPVGWPLFARPCPVSPQHGFVESRLVNNWDEVKKVWKETLAADPDGELMLVSPIKAKWNAIWTPSLLTLGEGHDGATAGKETITIPLLGLNPLPSSLMSQALIGAEEDPYIEAVGDAYTSNGGVLTQLRAGPKIKMVGPDFIPEDVEVTDIIRPLDEPDLLKWAVLMKEAKKGLVVWHPGGSPADHYFVHARINGVAVLTSRQPIKGEHLTKLPDQPDPPDPRAVLEGLIWADRIYLQSGNDMWGAAGMILLPLHHSAVMSGKQGVWLGLAAGMMLRLGSVALRGEARHMEGRKWPHGKPQRETVYERMYNKPLTFHRASINRLVTAFRYGNWPSSGFGGKKWAACAMSLVGLFESVRQLAQDQDSDAVNGLIGALNLAVNQAHNGGWWLNKFIPGNTFDVIQKGNLRWTLRCGVWAFGERSKRYKSAPLINQAINRFSQWPVTEVRPPRIKGAEMLYLPDSGRLMITVKSRMLGPKYQQMIVPISQFGPGKPKGEVHLTETTDGRLQLVLKGDEPRIVWQEDPIQLIQKESQK